MTTQEFTVRDFARKEQVTENTVRRWVAKGAVQIRRTPGGCIRVIERSYSRAVFVTTSDSKSHHPVT